MSHFYTKLKLVAKATCLWGIYLETLNYEGSGELPDKAETHPEVDLTRKRKWERPVTTVLEIDEGTLQGGGCDCDACTSDKS